MHPKGLDSLRDHTTEEAALKNKKFNYFTIVIYVLIIAALVIFVTSGNERVNKKPDELKTTDFYQLVREGLPDSYDDFANGFENTKIAAVQVTEETLYGLYVPNGESESSEDFSKKLEKFKKGKTYDFSVTVQSAEAFQKEMASLIAGKYPNSGLIADNITVLDYGFYCQLNPTPQVSWILVLLPYIIIGGVLLAFILFMNRANNKQGMNFGKSRAKTADELGNNVTFEDVAGADEEKQELREIVDFLRNPKAFTEMGARIPKGVLLVGPPGTGKTLLAKAVAGEAKVPFFSISSSEFVELYVGVGASRVRDLFHTAKRCAPAIIFIDEIDAVGRQRGAGLGGGHDEREQTLNQLLVEMDGFSNSQGIIVIAATNRPDVLDPALLRPGRFDRRITVNYPDVKGRQEILAVHAKHKTFEPDVDFGKIAKLTPGCTGADLENMLNEAAILAVRKNKNAISSADVDEAIKRVLYGPEKKSRVVSDENMRVVAYHEVGHAVVAHCTPDGEPVHEVSIIPRGRAAGYTRMLPSDTYENVTRHKLLDMIAVYLGGRAAEALFLSDVSTGAQNDLMRATEIARQIVTEYGMSDVIGPVYLAGEQEVFVGKSFGHARNFSEDVAAKIDSEIRRIMDEQNDRALKILDEHRDGVERVAAVLREKEQITGEEFAALFENKPLPEKKPPQIESESAAESPAESPASVQEVQK